MKKKLPYARLRKAQIGTLLVFLTWGHAGLSIVAWVPEFIDRLDVNFATWGAIIGFGIIGSILPLPFSSRLISRFGSRLIIRSGSWFAAVMLISLGLTNEPLLWFVLNAGFAFGTSLMGIALNAHAVMVQRHLGRNILGRFHAGWSIGAAAAALSGGVATAIMDLEWYLVAVAIVTVILVEVAMRQILPAQHDMDLHSQVKRTSGKRTKVPITVWFLSVGLLVSVFPEVMIIDWGAVVARDLLNLDASLRAAPYGIFTIGMIIGRLSMTRLAKRFHPSELASYGSYLAAVTLTAGVVFGPFIADSSWIAGLIFTGASWGFAGLGMSVAAPALFSAAGHVDGMSPAQVLARMSLFNALVQIGAKALVGAVSQGFGLQWAFLIAGVCAAAAGAISGQLAKQAKRKELADAYPLTGPISVIPIADDDKR